MSYTKQTWQTGDIITAEKLNHMEDGISSAQVYTESEQVRFSGSVTTEERNGAYGALIDGDLSDFPEQIKVIFDGTEYTCERIAVNNSFAYGGFSATGPDFSEYPFAVIPIDNGTIVYTETASTHQVEIIAPTKSVNQDLADVIPVMWLVSGVTNSADALAAFNAGKLLYFTYNSGFYVVTGIDQTNHIFIAVPSDGQATCNFSATKISIGAK